MHVSCTASAQSQVQSKLALQSFRLQCGSLHTFSTDHPRSYVHMLCILPLRAMQTFPQPAAEQKHFSHSAGNRFNHFHTEHDPTWPLRAAWLSRRVEHRRPMWAERLWEVGEHAKPWCRGSPCSLDSLLCNGLTY